MNAPEHDVVGPVTAFLQGLPGPFQAVAADEWGVAIEDVGGRQ